MNSAPGFTQAQNTALAQEYTKTLLGFYEEWMIGTPLADCIGLVSKPGVVVKCPFMVPENNNRSFSISYPGGAIVLLGGKEFTTSNIYVVGHPGLTVSGLSTAWDAVKKYDPPTDW